MPGTDTMRWNGEHLALLDQRRLPLETIYVDCADARQTAAAIRDMVVRGAPAIGCAAAFGLAAEAHRRRGEPPQAFEDAMRAAIDTLARSRPTAVNLFWALERMRAALERCRELSPAETAPRLEAQARRLFEEDLAGNRAMGEAGAALIPEGARILTHCNAGALATAGHGTALGVVRSARDRGKRVSVIACETRPYLQGARLTAWEMIEERIPVTLVTDNMAGHLMARGRVDLVIVGADRIAANGDTANKIGTYTLAVLAARHALPFYVAAPLASIDLALADGSAIPIEERPAAEVTGYGGLSWAPDGVEVANPAFDVTPAGLVSALITEKGVVRAPDAPGIRRLFER